MAQKIDYSESLAEIKAIRSDMADLISGTEGWETCIAVLAGAIRTLTYHIEALMKERP